MLRIVATAELRTLLEARGIAEEVRTRILRHGQISSLRDSDGQRFYDILVDRDANDLPDSVVTFLRNRAEIIYVAEWDMGGTWNVLKGADPGIHKFAGWPV